MVHCPVSDLVHRFNFSSVSREIVFLLENTDQEDLQGFNTLRLDSKVFVYSMKNQSFATIEELYQIKGGDLIVSPFGTWSEERGLAVPTANVWERRRDLMGVELVDTWMPFKPYTYEDEEGDIVGEF